MRLWHLILGIVFVAVVLAISREAVGRVALVVFITGLGEFILGLTAVMTLFQTVGAIGYARDLFSYLQAIAATLIVVAVASVTMNALLWLGIQAVQRVVP